MAASPPRDLWSLAAPQLARAGVAAAGPGELGPVEAQVCVRRASAQTALGMVFDERCTVTKVAAGSPASVAGLFRGMTVTRVNGTAVRTPAEAKRAGGSELVLTLGVRVDSGRRLRGTVVSWCEERGFGMLRPREPVFVPAGMMCGNEGTAVYVGHVFCHRTVVVGPQAPCVGEEVEFTALCVESRVRAARVLRCNGVASAAKAKKGASVEWWNVNNLRECNRVAFAGEAGGRALTYTKNGEARPAVRRVVFDGVRTLEMPEIAKRVHVPWEGRWGLLRALRALAESAGVKHNIPEAAAAEEEEEEAKVGQGGGGRGDGAMLCASTDYLWIGWLREEVRERTEQLRADVCGFLQGHAVASVRPCYGRGTQVGAHVELATPITQVQLAELNTREYHDGRRLTVDDAQRGNPYRAARQQQQQQRTGAGKGLQAVEVEVRGPGGRAMLDGAALDEGCAVLRVEAGSAASVAGLFAGMRVSAVGGAAVETRAELEAALLGCADEEAVLTAVVDSTGRLRGTVDSWDGERCSGRVSPAVPVFVSGGVLPGSRGTCVYLGDLGFRREALADDAAAAAAAAATLEEGKEVEFEVCVQGGRLQAASVRLCCDGSSSASSSGEAAEAGAGAQQPQPQQQKVRQPRAGSDMSRLVRGAPQVCMMHLGGHCDKVAEGATCAGGLHIPQAVRPAAAAAAAKEGEEEEEEEGGVLQRVGAAKLELLQQKVAEAAAAGREAQWGGCGMDWEVHAAWQLTNEALEFRYRATEYNLTREHGRTPDSIEGFHGTAEENVLSIARHGFDPLRRAGQVYGAGEYFAKDPSVSDGYCGGGAFMFVCSLLLGEAEVDHTWVPDVKYYVMKQRAGRIQCVPRYLVQFRKTSSPLLRTLQALGGEAESAEGHLRRVGASQRGGVRPCKGRMDSMMMAERTQHLWVGWLEPTLGRDDELVRADVRAFLRGHEVAMVKPERNAARVGAFVELRSAVTQAQVAELNTRAYGTGGWRVSVDDAQPGNPAMRMRRCPKLSGPGRFCRGWNLRGHEDWTEACSFRHAPEDFVTFGAEVSYVAVPAGSAKHDELAGEVEAKGLGRVVGVRRVVNTQQEAAYESRRAFTSALGGGGAERELWHGTACSVLDAVLRTGLQCPSDTQASETCPVSGGRGLCTTMCGADCAHCTEAHGWARCHMFGLGIYLADDPRKSHAYVRPVGRRHSLVRCRVNLGSPYLIEANLLQRDGMHGVVRCVDPQGKLDRNPHEWGVLKGHEAYCVKGLGAAARPEHGVINTEYVLFHPAQVLPLYVVDYETAGPVAPAAPRAVPASRGGFDLGRVDVAQQRKIWNQIQKARGRSVDDDDGW